MSLGKRILMRMLGRPKGRLGRLGGIIMARMNRKAAAQAIDLPAFTRTTEYSKWDSAAGRGFQILAAAASPGHVVGVDHSKEMVEQAAARNANAIHAGRVDLWQGSVERLPFEDETFDSALAVNSMQVWPDAVAGLREIRRVLKTGARIALAFTRYSGQPKGGLADALTAAGFTGVRIAEIDDGFCALATKS